MTRLGLLAIERPRSRRSWALMRQWQSRWLHHSCRVNLDRRRPCFLVAGCYWPASFTVQQRALKQRNARWRCIRRNYFFHAAVAVSRRGFRTRVRESPIWQSMQAIYVRRMCCPRSFHRASGIGCRIEAHRLGPSQAAKSAPSSPVRRG